MDDDPPITLPKTTLDYTQLANRLDKTGDGYAPYIKGRLVITPLGDGIFRFDRLWQSTKWNVAGARSPRQAIATSNVQSVRSHNG